MKQSIKIFTNPYPGGWMPDDIETMLGGGEESIVLFAEALIRSDFDVTVYHEQREKGDIERKEVIYQDREKAQCYDTDIFITWKDATPFQNGARGKLNIHWSSDVENFWDISNVDAFIHFTRYHANRHFWIDPQKVKIFPLGIDIDALEIDPHLCITQDPHRILYCSSIDRGLQPLIENWKQIKTHFPEMKLKVAYGLKQIESFSKDKRAFKTFENEFQKSLDQDGIEFLGTLTKYEINYEYRRSGYWILPLINPDSELFCLNAVKAQYTGCIPIVNKIGGLRSTVGEYIPFNDFINGKLKTIDRSKTPVLAQNWDSIVNDFWIPLFNKGQK